MGSTDSMGLEARPALLWGLVLAAALVPRLLVFPLNENYHGDSVARTELAERWLERPRWMTAFGDGAYQFGPLHLYAVGAALEVWPNRAGAGRAVSLVFGALTVLPLYFLARRYFGDRAAVWACLAFGVWGMHLQLSAIAASEALALFLSMATLALFARGLEERRFGPLALAAALVNLTCATRYDVWLLIPLLCLLLLARERGRPAAIVRAGAFGLLCLPFPLVWMAGNARAHGDPLYPVRFISDFHLRWFEESAAVWGELPYRLQNLFFWPGAAVVTLTPGVALFGMAGMALAFRRRPELRWLIWVAVLPAAYFTFRAVVLGTFVPLARFTVLQLALVLPFVAYGFEQLLAGAPARARRLAAGATVALALVVPLAIGLSTLLTTGRLQTALGPVSPTSIGPPTVRQVAEFLRREVAPTQDLVLLDEDSRYFDIQVAFQSGVPEGRMLRHRWPDFEERLAQARPRYLVRFDGGALERSGRLELVEGGARLVGVDYVELTGFAKPVHLYRRVEP